MIDSWTALFALALACFAATALGIWPLRRYLLKKAVLDLPNERSGHSVPTPRGAGLTVVPVLLGALLIWGYGHGATAVLAAVAAFLAWVSFLDDRKGLSVRLRFGAQVAATGLLMIYPAVIYSRGVETWPAAEGLALAAALLAVWVAWLWFINLFNFMDGMDGLAAIQTASLGLGHLVYHAVATSGGSPSPALFAPGLALIAVSLGFLVWNRPPARIFLGDSGSIPLGFLLFLLLILTGFRLMEGGADLLPVTLLPLYYWLDSTSTLILRVFRGETPWVAHRVHAYQRAQDRGWEVRLILCAVFGLNLCLIGLLAWGVAEDRFLAPVAAGVALTTGLILWFRRGPVPFKPARASL